MLLDLESGDLAPGRRESSSGSAAIRATSSSCRRASWRSYRAVRASPRSGRRWPRPGRARGGRRGRGARGAADAPVRGGRGQAQPGRALRRTTAEVRPLRAAAARVRAAGPRRARSAERAPRGLYALRSYSPEIAALAANAPFHEGEDTGSPRSGRRSPRRSPARAYRRPFSSWERYAPRSNGASAPERSGALAPGGGSSGHSRASGRSSCACRTPKPRSTRRPRGGRFAHCLIAWLGDGPSGGEAFAPTPAGGSRRTDGGRFATGWRASSPTSRRASGNRPASVHREARRAGAVRGAVGCAAELAGAGELIVINGAMRQRRVAPERGLRGLVGWLERFTAPRLD